MCPGGSSNFSGSPVSAGTHPGRASPVRIAAFGRSSRRLWADRRIEPNRLGEPVGSSVLCSSLHYPVPSIRTANREHVYRSSDSDVTRYRSSGRCSNEHNHILTPSSSVPARPTATPRTAACSPGPGLPTTKRVSPFLHFPLISTTSRKGAFWRIFAASSLLHAVRHGSPFLPWAWVNIPSLVSRGIS